jgi:hypothetical protein
VVVEMQQYNNQVNEADRELGIPSQRQWEALEADIRLVPRRDSKMIEKKKKNWCDDNFHTDFEINPLIDLGRCFQSRQIVRMETVVLRLTHHCHVTLAWCCDDKWK